MKLLDTERSSSFFGDPNPIKAKTLANWRSQGIGPKFIKIGRRVFYELAELERFARSREFQSTWAAKGSTHNREGRS